MSERRDELRSVVATLCGAVGFVLLASAPLSWVVTEELGPLVIGKVVVGAALAVVWLLTARDVWGRLVGGARPRLLVLVDVSTSLAVVVAVVAVNAVTVVSPAEIDVTREGIHTLAPQTREVLDRLGGDVDVYAFYAETEAETPAVRDLLRRFGVASPHVRVNVADPNLRLDLVKRFDLRSSGPRLVVVKGERVARSAEVSEEALTNAIMEVSEGEAAKIYWLTGHGEAALTDDSADGMTSCARSLRAERYEVAELQLFDSAGGGHAVAVPEDASLVLVVAPRGALMEAELGALDRFVSEGGSLFVALEPGRDGGLPTLLGPWKIVVRDDVIADEVSQTLGLGWSGPIIQTPPNPHPIAERLSAPAVMRTVRSLEIVQGGLPRVTARVLVQTGRSAWGETRISEGDPVRDDDDHPPPLVVGAVATYDAGDGHSEHGHAHAEVHEGRVAVFGDSDWMGNRLLPQQGNTDLFLNAVAWLVARPDKITIRPQARTPSGLALTPRDLGALKFITMDVLPVLLLAVGAGMVSLRRRR